MMRSIAVAAICLLLSASVTLGADPPVELRHLGYARDKQFNVHRFSMKLSNRGNKPMWLLLPGSGDDPRPITTVFRNVPGKPPIVNTAGPPSKIGFDCAGGMVVIGVDFYGFRAVRLPARTVLEIPEWNLTSRRDVTTSFNETAFDEADDLLVNGKVPLEKWLPFEVGVFKEGKWPSGSARRQSWEKVKYIEAKGGHRWTLKFQNKGEEP